MLPFICVISLNALLLIGKLHSSKTDCFGTDYVTCLRISKTLALITSLLFTKNVWFLLSIVKFRTKFDKLKFRIGGTCHATSGTVN